MSAVVDNGRIRIAFAYKRGVTKYPGTKPKFIYPGRSISWGDCSQRIRTTQPITYLTKTRKWRSRPLNSRWRPSLLRPSWERAL